MDRTSDRSASQPASHSKIHSHATAWKLINLLAHQVERLGYLTIDLSLTYIELSCGCGRASAVRARQLLVERGILIPCRGIGKYGAAPRYIVHPERLVKKELKPEQCGPTVLVLSPSDLVVKSEAEEQEEIPEVEPDLQYVLELESILDDYSEKRFRVREREPRADERGRARRLQQHEALAYDRLGASATEVLLILDATSKPLSLHDVTRAGVVSKWTARRKLRELKRWGLVRCRGGRWSRRFEFTDLVKRLDCLSAETISLTKFDTEPCISETSAVASTPPREGEMQQLCLTSESQPKRRLSPRRFPSPTGKLASEAIKYFCDRYRAQFNCPYVMDAKGRSIAAGNLLRLVQTLGLEEVKIRIDAYFREEWPAKYGGYHLVGFVKHHQRVASSEAAQQIRASRIDASVKYPEAQKVIDFFCRRYQERVGSGYYLDPAKRPLALQCLAPIVENLGLNQVKQRMAAYIDDEWVKDHSGHTLSGFIRDNQKYAGKAQEYAPPANLEFYAKMGPTVLPFGVARYGDGRPKFVGVCE